MGWGTLSAGGSLPLNLQQVTVQTVDYRASSCQSVLYDQQKQLCAGVSGGGKGSFHLTLFLRSINCLLS